MGRKSSASIAGVSINWLAYGDGGEPQELKISARHDTSDPAPMVNPQLYLSIAMGMIPAVTKEALPPMLTVPPQAIDDILAGKTVEYNPRWRLGYTLLAKNLDLPALRRDLRRLDAFLAWEEAAQKNPVLLSALQEYVAKSYEQVEVCSINLQEPSAVPVHVPYTDIILRGKGELDCTWYFVCPPEQDDPEEFFPEDLLSRAVDLAERRGCMVSVVLTSGAEYDKMCRYCERLEANDDANAELGIPSHLPQNVSVVHFDQQKERIDDAWEFPEDDYWTDES